jgi:hypothetical protein
MEKASRPRPDRRGRKKFSPRKRGRCVGCDCPLDYWTVGCKNCAARHARCERPPQTGYDRGVRAYCHPCGGDRRFRFAGNATDGREQRPGKPRALHHACTDCGHVILTLGNVPDAEGLCVTVARRLIHVDARGVEFEDAVGYLYYHIWKLYLDWQPHALSSATGATRSSFLGYASQWLPPRLRTFIANATGDAGTERRANPKPHAVSDSYDVLAEAGEPSLHRGGLGGLDTAVGRNGADPDDDRASELRWILGRGDREGARGAAL